MRVLIELLHVLAGLMATALIAGASAWAYPRATHDIWLVAYVVMIAVVVLGARQLVRAFRRDAQSLKGIGKGGRGNE